MIEQGNMVLVRGNGKPVLTGEKAVTFRGEIVVVSGGSAPHKAGSTGFVYVNGGGFGRELYPAVCGLKWVEKQSAALEY